MKKKIGYQYMMVIMFIMMLSHTTSEEKRNNIYLDNVFSYYANGLDVTTGNRPFGLVLATNLNRIEKVSTLKATKKVLKKTGDSKYLVGSEVVNSYTYKNGLLQSRYYSYSDTEPTITYTYDKLNRLTAISDSTYVYLETEDKNKIQREVYRDGNLYQSETVQLTEDGFEVIIFPKLGNYRSLKYRYENEKLVELINSSKAKDGNWEEVDRWALIYENDKLSEVINFAPNSNDIRSHQKILKYDRKNILELERKYYNYSGSTSTDLWLFSKHDRYGNWTKAEVFEEGILVEEHEREIKYR